MIEQTITIELIAYWHAGTGRGGGTQVDALTERDIQGLPFISGKHLKGLLRCAVECIDTWAWLADIDLPAGPAGSVVELLFGSPSQLGPRAATMPGMLRISDAALPAAEYRYLRRGSRS